MTPNITQILDDLYEVDPSLREHEARLRPLILELIEVRSDLAINPAFRSRLRAMLMEKISHQHVAKPSFGFFFAGRSMYTMASVLVLILVVAASVMIINRGGDQVAFEQDITKTKDEAFGPLTVAPAGGRGGDGGVETSGQKSLNTAASAPSVGVGGGYGGGSDTTKRSSLIYPVPQPAYTFKYTGDPISLTDKTVEVLRRVKGASLAPAFNSVIKQLNVSGINLSSFGASKIQNLVLAGSEPDGYTITIDFFEGFIGISKTTPFPGPRCMAPEKCLYNQPPAINQKPDDTKLINAANKFLEGHGINTSAYGEPIIQDDQRVIYKQTMEGQRDISYSPDYYIPDAVTVLYPLILNGQTVYEQGGMFPMSLQVQVSVYDLTITSVWNMTIQQYESSKYEAETDSAKIIAAAENWGWGGYVIMAESVRPVQVTQASLGTPSRGYLRMWNYNNGANDELYVPALVFPVMKAPIGSYLPKYIVVPLAKDLITQQYPEILPMKGVAE